MIRIAIIGTNKITRRFLEAVQKTELLKLTGVYSRTIEKAVEFGTEFGAEKFYDRLEPLASDPDIDAVYIASPNYCHCAQAVMLMQAGKHVLVEKPAASNLAEFTRMAQAARQNHVILLEAMRCVIDPAFDLLAAHLDDIGEVRQVILQYCQYSSRYDNYKNGIIENAFRPELSNGSLMDIGVYCTHLMAKLFGMPKKIQADAVFLPNQIDGAGTILAHYDDFQVQLVYSKICDSFVPSQIMGEKGTLTFRELPNIHDIDLILRNGEQKRFPLQKDSNNMLYEAIRFAEMINGQDSAACEECLRVSGMEMQIMDEARRQIGLVFPADTFRHTQNTSAL